MKLIHTVTELDQFLAQAKSKGSLALVPTMGNLHQGHLSLVDKAKTLADTVLVSVFVNPTQFGEGEDFDAYPRTLSQDAKLLEGLADAVFAPSTAEVYPVYPPEVTVKAGSAANGFCGSSRPGHFDGVCTVVAKLFNLCQPDVACFGEKDFQQLAVIRQMARDLNFKLRIEGVATKRAPSGLALSSRNGFLSQSELKLAAKLYAELELVGAALKQENPDFNHIERKSVAALTELGFEVDYLSVAALDLTQPKPDVESLVVLVAARLGTTRLIDNLVVNLKR